MQKIVASTAEVSIQYLTKEYEDGSIFDSLDSLVAKWFSQKFKTFAPPQKYSIISIHNRENTLISAPTGSGKTLSAFLSIISELVSLSKQGKLEDRVYCVYISPLRALSRDIEVNLKNPLAEIEKIAGKNTGIRVAVRTSDTTASEKQKMLKKPPHILITTPESLGIVLCAPKFKGLLEKVEWVIVDEIHSLAPNKRGVHLSVSIERLQNLAGPFTRIGLSATVAPLEEIAKFLVGFENGKERDCKIVDVQYIKKLDLKVLCPVPNIMSATQQELHNELYKLLDELIQAHKTTLIFTNTRSATERVVHHLKTKYPKKYAEDIGAHHSSLSRTHRHDLEDRLRKGELKVVVCSTSLELGIDIGYIDLVILLGSPKSTARVLQRCGRSGHHLHDKIKGRFIVLDRDDLVECSVMLKNAFENKIDKIEIPQNCLDVLAQHIYGLAIESKQHAETAFELVKRSYCYRNLPFAQFESVLKYLAGEYVSLEARSVYAKVWYDEKTKMFGRRSKIARVIYSTNIGTIPDESYLEVKYGEERIGMLDEGFLERLHKGDIFVLGGNTYRFNFARGMTVQVTPVPHTLPTVPSWYSEMLPLSFDVAIEIGKFRRLMDEKFRQKLPKKEMLDFILSYLYVDENSANSIYEYFREQFLFAEVPHDKKIIIEFYSGFGEKKFIIFHTLYGRRVNDALSRAIAYEISRISRNKNIAIALTDNGFYLTSESGKMQVLRAFQNLQPENLREILKRAIDQTEILKRRFRHCATRSLMILRSYKGHRKSVGRQQMGSQVLLSAVRRLDDHFPILEEARREVLEDLMDVNGAGKVLNEIKAGKIKTTVTATDIPSPFALNLIVRGYLDILKMEDKLEFVRRMHKAILKQIEPYEIGK